MKSTLDAFVTFVSSLVDALFPLQRQSVDLVCIQPPPPRPPKPKPPAGFLIGTSRPLYQPIYAIDSQLDRHVLIVGATGCGKSTLIARFFTEEISKWQ